MRWDGDTHRIREKLEKLTRGVVARLEVGCVGNEINRAVLTAGSECDQEVWCIVYHRSCRTKMLTGW